MDDTELRARVSVAALTDIEKFIHLAQHLKALTVQLQQRRARESRLQASLAQQITTDTAHARELVRGNPRLLELWAATQAELALLMPEEPCPGGAAATCETGARGTNKTAG